jgi:hypothetical protein
MFLFVLNSDFVLRGRILVLRGRKNSFLIVLRMVDPWELGN